jgi:hypothetical protein
MRIGAANIPNVTPADRVDWWVETVGTTNVPIEYIPTATRSTPPGAARPIGAKVQHAETAIHAPSGKFRNRITFPHVGGDQYVVKAAKKVRPVPAGRSELTTDTFETWRKLYYSVFYMGNDALTMFNNLEPRFKAAFAEGFTEFENTQKVATLTELARADCNTDFRFMSGASGAYMDMRHSNTGASGTGTTAHKPFEVVMLVVPDCYYTTDEALVLPTERAAVGSTVVRYEMHRNPGPSFRAATVSWTGQAPVDVRAHLTVTAVSSFSSTVNWDLRPVAGLTTWIATAPHSFRLQFTGIREHGLMGYSLGNFCVVRTLDGITDVLQTFTHEVGHGIRQAVQMENRWNDAGVAMAPDYNPRWHTNPYGGQGPHCHTNAKLVPASAARIAAGHTTGQIYAWDSGTLCTMFFRGDSHVDQDGKFCGVACQPRIRRRPMDRATMVGHPSRWRRWDLVG